MLDNSRNSSTIRCRFRFLTVTYRCFANQHPYNQYSNKDKINL